MNSKYIIFKKDKGSTWKWWARKPHRGGLWSPPFPFLTWKDATSWVDFCIQDEKLNGKG